MEALSLDRIPRIAPSSAGNEGAGSLRIDLIPDERAIQHVRTMVHSFALLAGCERMLAARLMLGAAQLVEIVGKRDDPATLNVVMRPSVRLFSIEVSFDGTERELATLRRELDAVNRVSPAEAYSQALTSLDADAERRLCLSRIRYEGQLSLSLRKELGRLVIAAEAP